MKKIISDNVIQFPFDNAIKVDVRGKPLSYDEDIKQQKLMSNLKEAMFLLLELNESFSDINGEYYTVESYFKKQCKEKKESDSTFNERVFAKCEKKRIKSKLKKIKLLSDGLYDFYQEETYSQVLKYIEHLEKVINGQIQEVESDIIHTLLIHKPNNEYEKILDNILIKCKESLHGIKFDKIDYAALYLIISTKYKNFFKPGTHFTDIQKCFDEYFKQDTRTYKAHKVKDKADELKRKNYWIDKL